MLREISKRSARNQYPYNTIDFEHLRLNAPVVFFTGENGSGKSTLLRAISIHSNSYTVAKNIDYNSSQYLDYSLSWSQKLKRGYYFQSEDFYSFLNWVSDEEKENKDLYDDAKARHGTHSSMGTILELGMHEGNRQRMNNMVDEFKLASHGEGYIRFFASKLRPNTLYLLDEPETPLSFQNQLTLISLIHEYVNKGSQFIICTHSPILLAYPDALIYQFDQNIREIDYNDHPTVKDYKSFLSRPDHYLHYLLDDEA